MYQIFKGVLFIIRRGTLMTKTIKLHMDFVSVESYKPNMDIFGKQLPSVFEDGDRFVRNIIEDMKQYKCFVYYHKIKAFHNKKTVGWEGLIHKQYCYRFSNEKETLHIQLRLDTWYKKIPKIIEQNIDKNAMGGEEVNNIFLFDNKQFIQRREFFNYIDKYLENRIKGNVETF